MAKAPKRDAKQKVEQVRKVTKRPRLKGSVKRTDTRATSHEYLGQLVQRGLEERKRRLAQRSNKLRSQGVSSTIARNIAKWEARRAHV
jgi:hypothetical protein